MADDTSKKRLGRGLAALIGEMDQPLQKTASPKDDKGAVIPESPNAGDRASSSAAGISADKQVPVEHIRANPNNPRRHFSDAELQDLASSIAKHGVVQPILVRSIKGEDLGGAKYEIIAGERRWRASQKAGLHTVPILIREVGDAEALELAIIENVQRSDLNPVEEALGYQQLIDEYDYSQADLGQVIGKSRSHVANTLRLLKLPEKVQAYVTDGALSAGHARTLVTVEDPLSLADKIIKDGLSVRQAEGLASEATNPAASGSALSGGKTQAIRNADVVAVEKQLEDILGLKTKLAYKPNGAGELKIKFKTLDQLDDLCRRLERK